jgi:hypothetical protein
MALYRDEAPLLSSNAAVDEGLGIETSIGSKILGSFEVALTGLNATTAVSQAFYIAPYPVEVVGIKDTYAVNSTSGNMIVEKTPISGNTAVGSGNNLMTAVSNWATNANNSVTTETLVTTKSFLQLTTGDRLSALFAGTLTGLIGGTVQIQLKRI